MPTPEIENVSTYYVSLLGIVCAAGSYAIVGGQRSHLDEFRPDTFSVPSGRKDRGESVSGGLFREIIEEVPRLEHYLFPDVHYLGDREFMRDGFPVCQLAFGVRARVGTSWDLGFSDELGRVEWITEERLIHVVEADSFYKPCLDWMRLAKEKGLYRLKT